MTAHPHHRKECRHGVLVAQCKCLGNGLPDRVDIVPCPAACTGLPPVLRTRDVIESEIRRLQGTDPEAGFDWREAQS